MTYEGKKMSYKISTSSLIVFFFLLLEIVANKDGLLIDIITSLYTSLLIQVNINNDWVVILLVLEDIEINTFMAKDDGTWLIIFYGLPTITLSVGKINRLSSSWSQRYWSRYVRFLDKAYLASLHARKKRVGCLGLFLAQADYQG